MDRWVGMGRIVLATRAILPAIALLVSGCASSHDVGVPAAPSTANPDIQELTQKARSGDKQAQFTLGMRYEQGIGVGQDRQRAIDLYRLAAQSSSGTTWIYVPGVGKETLGRVMPVRSGQKADGLAAAKERLAAIEGQRAGLLPQITEASRRDSQVPEITCHARASDGQAAPACTMQEGDEMIDILNNLSNASAGSLSISDIEDLFQVKLIQVDSDYGQEYSGRSLRFDCDITVYSPPDGRIGLDIKAVKNQFLKQWNEYLIKRGWVNAKPIRFLFIMDIFYKNGRQIRVEHDNVRISSIVVLGLNTPGEGE